MATQLILTVGTNALPVWVAWYCLKDKLPPPVYVQFVYTPGPTGTEDQKKLLTSYCKGASATVLQPIQTSANNPNRQDICNKIINQLPPGCKNIHVHYTGGTQAMGVATVSAMLLAKVNLIKKDQTVNIDASYLDPGRESAPNIVSWVSNPLVGDTRENIDPDIHKIANLNDFKAGDFYSKHYKPHNCPPPGEPTSEKLCAGQTVLENIRSIEGEFMEYFSKTASCWNKIFRKKSDFIHPGSDGTFSLPEGANVIWKEKILPVLNNAYTNCQWCLSSGTLAYASRSSATEDQKRDLEGLHGFLNGIWLEYAVYAAFKKVLEDIKSTNSCRKYALFHNVYVRPKDASDHDPHFELDVVAVLGYQVVVVSCGVTSNRKEIKLKAMEAYHRAKQLGGDEARAVVVCVAHHGVVQGIEKELKDETGTERPLQVWGRSKTSKQLPNMDSLRGKFDQLLKTLHWQ